MFAMRVQVFAKAGGLVNGGGRDSAPLSVPRSAFDTDRMRGEGSYEWLVRCGAVVGEER